MAAPRQRPEPPPNRSRVWGVLNVSGQYCVLRTTARGPWFVADDIVDIERPGGAGLSFMIGTGTLAVAEHRLTPKVILIANDQEWTARSLESVLAPHGYVILRAFTGQQALDRARAGQPSLILLDAQLPDIHGFDVCRTLRSDPLVGPGIPVIITTAGPSGRAQKLEATKAGAWDFFGQPLDGELVLAKVETFLRAADALRSIRAESLLHETASEPTNAA